MTCADSSQASIMGTPLPSKIEKVLVNLIKSIFKIKGLIIGKLLKRLITKPLVFLFLKVEKIKNREIKRRIKKTNLYLVIIKENVKSNFVARGRGILKFIKTSAILGITKKNITKRTKIATVITRVG